MTKARSNATANAAKGDLTVGNGTNLSGVLGVGSNGETIVADSSTATGLRWQSPVNANPVLNSAFQIAQRGTSLTVGNGYTLDRWYGYSGGAGRTVSQQVTGDTTNLPFIQYCARVQRTNGNSATNEVQFYNLFETINSIPFAGKTLTLSFYARRGANYAPATANALEAEVTSGPNTDNNPIASGTWNNKFINSNVTLTTTWQRFTLTGTMPATDTQLFIRFRPGGNSYTGTAGANDWFEVTGVQLEVGSVATPFKTYAGTIQGELAACQRYYYRQTPSTSYGWVGYGLASGTTGGAIGTTFPVQMRTTPNAVEFSTLSVSDASSAIAVTSLTLDTSVASANVGVCNFGVASGLTTYRPYYLRQNASASGYLAYTAEL